MYNLMYAFKCIIRQIYIKLFSLHLITLMILMGKYKVSCLARQFSRSIIKIKIFFIHTSVCRHRISNKLIKPRQLDQ